LQAARIKMIRNSVKIMRARWVILFSSVDNAILPPRTLL
jgi:hypothetical protein